MSNKSAFKSQPDNPNSAQPTRFQMIFARLPNVTYWCQTIILPGVSTSYVSAPTPFVDQKLPGDKLVYESLVATMLVDEDLKNWKEVHDWLRAFTFPTDFKEYKNMNRLSDVLKSNNTRPQYSDIIVHIFNNNWQRTLTYKFYDAFPTSLGALSYSASDGPETPMIADVTFDYQYFDIEVAPKV
jgi:hypothetical protein